MVTITIDGKIKSNPNNGIPKTVFVVEILYYRILNIPTADRPLKKVMDSDIQIFKYYQHAVKYAKSEQIKKDYPNFHLVNVFEIDLSKEIIDYLED